MPAEAVPARRRWALAAGAVVGVALLAGGGWWLASQEGQASPQRPQASAHAAGAGSGAATAQGREEAVPLPQAASSLASGPVSGGHGEAACPSAWRELAGQSADAIDRVFARLRPAALSRAAVLLSASGDPFERLAAQLLAGRARSPEQAPSAETMLALVSEALGSGDPRMAGLAAQLCATPFGDAPAACSSLPTGHWAAVDPDNVHAWLALAGDAQDRGDSHAVREAMTRASQAGHTRLMSAELVRLASSPALHSLSPVEREVLVIDLIGVGMTLTSAQLIDTSRLCPTDRLGPARAAQCGAVAELLVGRGQTLLEHGLGISLGRRVGWDAERVAQLEDEQLQMLRLYGESTLFWPSDKGPLTTEQACEIHRRLQAVTDAIASDTELALARRVLERARSAPVDGAP